jgi:hypothetical protein
MEYTRAQAKQAARECFTGLWAAITTPSVPAAGWTTTRCAAISAG